MNGNKKNFGWAPSCDPTTTILAPWLSATPCSMYKKKKKRRKAFPSLSYSRFKTLQFHWETYNSIESMYPYERGSASQRMPQTLGEIFTHTQLLHFNYKQNRNRWAGRARLACSSSNTCAASRDPISAASAVANCGWNYCWWINWQRRFESWSSSSSLQRGWSAIIATRWSSPLAACSIRYHSLHVSSSANDSLKKFTGARSRRPHHSHFSHGRQNRRSSFCCCRTVREEVRIWWHSRGL